MTVLPSFCDHDGSQSGVRCGWYDGDGLCKETVAVVLTPLADEPDGIFWAAGRIGKTQMFIDILT